jgi:hypothetical protein
MRNRCLLGLGYVAVAAALILAGCDDSDKDGVKSPDAASDVAATSDVAAASEVQPSGEQPLPASLKGYELYAWDEGEVLWFTLVTGTNRNKTLDEITQKNADVRQDGFVLINSSGWDQLQRVLALVPRGTPIIFVPTITGMPALGAQSRTRIMQMLQAIGP